MRAAMSLALALIRRRPETELRLRLVNGKWRAVLLDRSTRVGGAAVSREHALPYAALGEAVLAYERE